MNLLETYPAPTKPRSDTGVIIGLWTCAALVILIGTWQSAYGKGYDDHAAEVAPVMTEQVRRTDAAESDVKALTSALSKADATVVEQSVAIKTLTEDNEQLAKGLTTAHTVARTPRKRVARASAHRTVVASTSGVEKWRPMVKRYFHGNTDAALRVMAGESHGNPNASNGPCLGLSQIDKGIHADKIAEKARSWGMKPNLYDPVFNIRFAAYMTNYGRDWSNWSCKP